MAVTSKSEFIKSAKAIGKDVVQAAKEKGSSFLEDPEICDLLDLKEHSKTVLGAKVSQVRYGVDKNKDHYFAIDYVLLEGQKGLQIGQYIGLPKTNKEQRLKRLKVLMRVFSCLGIDVDSWTAANAITKMVNAADQITGEKPCISLGLSKYVGNDKVSRVNYDVVSLLNENDVASVDSGSEGAVQDLSEIGGLADQDDEDAVNTLTELAEAAELNPNEYGSWVELAEALQEPASADGEPEPPEDEEPEPPADEAYDETVKVSDEDADYYESCIGYVGSFEDEDGDTISASATAYERDTNMLSLEGDDGTEYVLQADIVTFED